MSVRFVFDFKESAEPDAVLLGGKGAGLAAMTSLGLPVPPGFTITTEACRHYLRTGTVPEGLTDEITDHVHGLEAATGRRFGDPSDPLLVSVRSGAAQSMPGMMDTILDIGLDDDVVEGLAKLADDRRFALDAYRRLVQMFGRVVRGVPGEAFEERLARAGDAPDATVLATVVADFKGIYSDHTGEPFPADPYVQLIGSVEAVFKSWNARRARDYRRLNGIGDDAGTAVNVQTMVFGNRGPNSGTGVAFTRDPNTGERTPMIDFLGNAQGEDVVAGTHKTVDRDVFAAEFPEQERELQRTMQLLERRERDVCDLEFTIEDGHLWLLQVRRAKRTAPAAVRIAVELADERMIDRDEALLRVTPAQLDQLLHPRFDPDADLDVLARGVAASPGAATGAVVFDPDVAERHGRHGNAVILVREVTSPDDLHGMAASRGILTAQGGNLSHAAIVAKGMGIPAVCGADIAIDYTRRTLTARGRTVGEGEIVSIDGSGGLVCLGQVPVIMPEPGEHFERLLGWADQRRRLGVRANADLPTDCENARRLGAEGIGLCRTEHMFLGDRLPLLRRYIMSGYDEKHLHPIREQQQVDFVGILEAMDGLPVTIRLLDPPLHEFLPDLDDLLVRHARGEATPEELEQIPVVRGLQEENPMLGLRGCRLGITHPSLYRMQVAAIAWAAVRRVRDGGHPIVEIMIPLVSEVRELEFLRRHVEEVWDAAMSESGEDIPVRIGTMIEVPRAALTAGEIASAADFFSFGTNDLTQMTWAFSRDDAQRHFFEAYLEDGLLPVNPFDVLDAAGVGRLVAIAAADGRATHPGLHLGVCGEHGGDPRSVQFFHDTGLDYLSCSQFRVPMARLAAGQAAIRAETRPEPRPEP
ncbi:MAG: pyruvate, phosphate dikinase [Acidimicrobiia bacterium]